MKLIASGCKATGVEPAAAVNLVLLAASQKPGRSVQHQKPVSIATVPGFKDTGIKVGPVDTLLAKWVDFFANRVSVKIALGALLVLRKPTNSSWQTQFAAIMGTFSIADVHCTVGVWIGALILIPGRSRVPHSSGARMGFQQMDNHDHQTARARSYVSYSCQILVTTS